MDSVGGSKLNNVLKAKEDLLKTPEELESEKRHVISERVGKLGLNGLSEADLRAQVGSLFFSGNQINLLFLIHKPIFKSAKFSMNIFLLLLI